jgi:hypothetical protein
MTSLPWLGELTLDHTTRWIYWFLAMLPFLFVRAHASSALPITGWFYCSANKYNQHILKK